MNKIYWRAMKLISLLLLGGLLSLHAATFSQSITLNHTNLTYEKIFEEVRSQSGYRILLNKSLLNSNKKIAVNANNLELDLFMKSILDREGLEFKKNGKNIFIFQSKNLQNPPQSFSGQLDILTGTVLDVNGQPLAGASVILLAKDGQKILSVITDRDGKFTIQDAVEGNQVRIAFIGYDVYQSAITKADLGNIVLQPSATGLQDVIITGVAVGTSKYKLPFSVTKVDQNLINTVPAIDLSQTLRAKVAGVNIYQSEGDGSANVTLRGAKSFFGNIAPLIVVDGYVSNLTLGDLNPQDVESIEVVKGAAASALYGTRAEGGVIQIITKKGKDAKGKLAITLDNEYGQNNIQRTADLANLHRYKTNLNDEFGFMYLTDQAGRPTTSRIPNFQGNGFSSILSPYKNNYDNVGLLLNNRPYFTNFISISNSGEKYNTYISFQNQQNSGIAKPIGDNIRRTLKLNLQLRPNPKWEIETNIHYLYNSTPSELASGGGAYTFFGSILLQEPFINLDEKGADGEYLFAPRGYNLQTLNLNFNPLYQYGKRDYSNKTHNILAGAKVRYSLLKNFNVEVASSVNQTFSNISDLYPKGYRTVLEDLTLNNGNLALTAGKSTFVNGQAQLNYQKTFGDFDFAASAKSVYELYYSNTFTAQGYNFSVPLYVLQNTQAASRTISGSEYPTGRTVNYGHFLNLRTGFRNKIFVDILGRIDQSSRFGSNAQTAFFPRASVAYRLTEDLKLGKDINEIKLRASWGQAGTLPPFNAKESLATVGNTGISITQNENTYLERSYTSELEFGVDAKLFKKLDLSLTYAKANSRGDFVRPPVFGPSLGTTPAYKNFGHISSGSLEIEARANEMLSGKNVSVDFGLTFTRTRSLIKELGQGLPAFFNGIYRVDEGLSPWAFFGQKVLSSLAELEVVNGLVTNAAGGTRPLSDFTVNSLGHVVLASAVGTANERPLLLQENGVAKSVVIGDGQPDFVAGFNTNITLFNHFRVYTTLEWQKGGSKYSGTTQYLTGFDRSLIWQNYAVSGLPQAYAQTLYNGNTNTSFWLEDSSYFSLREISLSYALPSIKGFSVLKNASIALTGRNLYTWSDFSGSNPEGYIESYPYPVYRTYTAKLTLNF